MKKLISVVAQFILFLVIDVVGSLFFQPFHLRMALSGNPAEPRMYVWDGAILMALMYVVLLLIAGLRKRIALAAPWTTLALLLAAVAGFGLKLGFVTQNW